MTANGYDPAASVRLAEKVLAFSPNPTFGVYSEKPSFFFNVGGFWCIPKRRPCTLIIFFHRVLLRSDCRLGV